LSSEVNGGIVFASLGTYSPSKAEQGPNILSAVLGWVLLDFGTSGLQGWLALFFHTSMPNFLWRVIFTFEGILQLKEQQKPAKILKK